MWSHSLVRVCVQWECQATSEVSEVFLKGKCSRTVEREKRTDTVCRATGGDGDLDHRRVGLAFPSSKWPLICVFVHCSSVAAAGEIEVGGICNDIYKTDPYDSKFRINGRRPLRSQEGHIRFAIATTVDAAVGVSDL